MKSAIPPFPHGKWNTIETHASKAETIVAAPDYQKAVADLDLDLVNSPFLQNGSGLDHEAASLIASASFAINIGDRNIGRTR